MKSKRDLVSGWLRKARSDLKNARMCVAAGESLDTACFHAQQAGELRYDHEFWPTIETARRAVEQAEKVLAFVRARLPEEMLP